MNEAKIQQIMDSLRKISKYCKTRGYCTAEDSDDGGPACPFCTFCAFCYKNFDSAPEDWFKEEV